MRIAVFAAAYFIAISDGQQHIDLIAGQDETRHAPHVIDPHGDRLLGGPAQAAA